MIVGKVKKTHVAWKLFLTKENDVCKSDDVYGTTDYCLQTKDGKLERIWTPLKA